MRTRLALIGIFVLSVSLFLLMPWSASAQITTDTPVPASKCDPSAALKEAAAMQTSGDSAKDLDALLTLSHDISAIAIACKGAEVTGQGDKVIGPLNLPNGFYRVDVRSEGGVSLTGTVDGGDCGQNKDVGNTLFFDIIPEGRQIIESAVNAIKDCKLVLQVGLSFKPWTLTVEPIK